LSKTFPTTVKIAHSTSELTKTEGRALIFSPAIWPR
jgi:hypothetical protein